MDPTPKKLKTALESLKDSIQSWAAEVRIPRAQRTPPDQEDRNLLAKDIRDLRKVRDLFHKNQFLKAAIHADKLDTLVRDQIPQSCWKIMRNSIL